MPKISLPWNRAKDFDQGCNSCKAGSSDTGFSETGFSEPQVTSEPSYSSGQVIDGQVIDGSVINGQVIDGQVINGQVIDGMVSGESSRHTLYHPEVVGPAHTSTVSTTASYAGELIPRPASPTVDLGK